MIVMEPIAYVHTTRTALDDDRWGGVESVIVLTDALAPEALLGIEAFSHAEIIYLLDRVEAAEIVRGARHPRGDIRWPLVGILAQRGSPRPNRIASTIARIVAHEPGVLRVSELDAVDNTPVLDIKPVMREFLPRGPVRQPSWSHELMADYWTPPAPRC
jgi:tRNA (Thr-GGU) A37 N-methylase